MLISAVELAGLQLPKLPNSRQGIEYHAKKNNWPFEEVAGRARGGKLKKYLVSALPSEVQAAIREKQAATLLAKVPVLPAEVKKPLQQNKKMRQLGLIPCEEGLARLDDRQTETAHARCAIVAHVLPLHELAGMPIKKAVAFVVAEAAAGRLPEDVARLIPLANARNNGERGLSEPTLYRWVRAYRAAPDSMSRLLALAPVKTREKTPLLAIDWLPYFLMFYQRPNKPTMMAAAKKLAQWYRDWTSSDFDTNAAAVWMKDGRLKIARSKDGKSAAQWVKEGAVWTASFARGPALVENGQLITNSDTYLSARAAIGQRSDRSIVLLNLEGVSGSYGATLEKSGQIMLEEGCVTAVALDAGGSSQVWYGDAYACPSSDNGFQTGRPLPSAIEIIADIIEPYDTGWIPVATVAGVTAGSDAQGGAAIAYRQTGKQIEMRLDVVAELKTNKELIITSESMPQRFLSKDYRPIRGMASGFGGALVPWWSGTYISLLPQKDTPYAYGNAVWYSKNSK